MERSTEIALMEELFSLRESREFYLDEQVYASPVERYCTAEQFKAEQKCLFRSLPLIAAHSSELPGPGSFLTRDLAGLPTLITRDSDGRAHAFLNVCRHRGAQLESASSGCKRAFSCPYHAWTWANTGDLKGVPHQKHGFPDLNRSEKGLVRLPMREQYGAIWVIADPKSTFDIDGFIAPLEKEFAWFQMPDLAVAHSDRMAIKANWKLLVEGGIEAYHFKATHKETIGPHFLDNLSSYKMLGSHMRSFLPKNSLRDLPKQSPETWRIREHGNILYSIFPVDQFLLMEDHIAWVSSRPLSANETDVRVSTLALASEVTPEKANHWARNHNITVSTLMEDFEVNESIQKGITSGANDTLTFGRFEGALGCFNDEVNRWTQT